jgi:hypothetical protein
MPNSPVAASASRRSLKRLEMDQVRTTLSKQDPGQHRVGSRPSAATALGSRTELKNCRSTEEPANSEPHFACWAVNALPAGLQCTCRLCVCLEVTNLRDHGNGAARVEVGEGHSCLRTPFEPRLKIGARVAQARRRSRRRQNRCAASPAARSAKAAKELPRIVLQTSPTWRPRSVASEKVIWLAYG